MFFPSLLVCLFVSKFGRRYGRPSEADDVSVVIFQPAVRSWARWPFPIAIKLRLCTSQILPVQGHTSEGRALSRVRASKKSEGTCCRWHDALMWFDNVSFWECLVACVVLTVCSCSMRRALQGNSVQTWLSSDIIRSQENRMTGRCQLTSTSR